MGPSGRPLLPVRELLLVGSRLAVGVADLIEVLPVKIEVQPGRVAGQADGSGWRSEDLLFDSDLIDRHGARRAHDLQECVRVSLVVLREEVQADLLPFSHRLHLVLGPGPIHTDEHLALSGDSLDPSFEPVTDVGQDAELLGYQEAGIFLCRVGRKDCVAGLFIEEQLASGTPEGALPPVERPAGFPSHLIHLAVVQGVPVLKDDDPGRERNVPGLLGVVGPG